MDKENVINPIKSKAKSSNYDEKSGEKPLSMQFSENPQDQKEEKKD